LEATVEKGFFGSLFDFSFESFVTTKLVPVLYGIALLGVVLASIGLMTRGTAGLILGVLFLGVGVIYARVLMETIIVFFRIAEHTRDMANAMRGTAPSPPLAAPVPSSEVRFDSQTGKPLDQA
jgi:hypothetical protein